MKHPDSRPPPQSVDTSVSVSLVAEEIRRRMKERGQNAKELARMAGVGHTYIYDLLTGRSSSPVLGKLRKIAAALDCDVEDLTHPETGGHGREPQGSYHVDTSGILPLRPSEYALINLWRVLPRRAKDDILAHMTRLIPGRSTGGSDPEPD